MSRSWYWKVFMVVMLTIFATLYVLPTVVRQRDRIEEEQKDADGNPVLNDKGQPIKKVVIKDTSNLPAGYPKMFQKYLTLGLDLQGGVLLQYGVDVDAALQSKANLYSDDIQRRLTDMLAEKGVDAKAAVKPTDSGAIITTEPAAAISNVEGDFFDKNFTTYDSGSQTATYIKVFRISSQSDTQIELSFTKEYRAYLERYAVDQGIQTINQRIDKLAVKEPEVRKGASDSIVIQLPGLSEADFGQTQEIIEQTAQLQFKKVDDTPSQYLNELSQRIPIGSPIKTENRGGSGGSDTYLRALDKNDLISALNELTNFAEEEKDASGRVYFKTLEQFRKALPSAKEIRFNDIRKETLRIFFESPTDVQVVKDGINQFLANRKTDEANKVSAIIDKDFTIQTEAGTPAEDGQPQNVFILSKRLRVPEDHDLLLSKETETNADGGVKDEYWRTNWLFRKTEITGEYLTDAQVDFDENRRPVVSFTMNAEGAVKLAKLSEEAIKPENPNKRFAIILDNEVRSAPAFQSKIPNGRGQITLGGAKNPSAILKEAKSLAIVLQAGALPAPLTRQFVTQVGPQLGQDAVTKGFLAATVGVLLVFAFLAIYYKKAGLIAGFALALNLLFLLGVMAALGATLTLPGIAGIVLTIGTAVDSNVLIFERIREELALGKTPRQAIDAGYNNALRAIIDANATNLISALVLSWYGSGPVKGFAITLIIGLCTSVFTSTFVTRLVFDYIASRSKLERLSI